MIRGFSRRKTVCKRPAGARTSVVTKHQAERILKGTAAMFRCRSTVWFRVCILCTVALPGSANLVPAQELQQKAAVLRPADHGVGRFVPDTRFRDLSGTERSLAEFSGSKATVVAMTSTSCPLSRKYLPALQRLVQAYSDRGVQWILVNPMSTDKTDDMQAAAKDLRGMTGKAVYVHDPNEELARHVSALTTTDVLVLDPARTVVYHGAIDDQYGIGYSLDAPRQHYLASALDAVLAGQQPEMAATTAPGCALETSRKPPESTAITWHNRISRIVQQNCLECHRSGGVGPFSLESADEVISHAAMIRQVVERRQMPPWFAAAPAGQHASPWANDRSLTDPDREDLLAWINGDRKVGDPADAPAPRQFAKEWTIGTPDLVVQLPRPIPVKAEGTMPYQFVTVDTTVSEDKWIQGYEILPTDRSVVHHVIVNVHEKGGGRIRDRDEGIGGYWAAYVPGNSSQIYPPGFARKLPKGATVSFQIHYTPSGQATQDQLRMGLIYAKSEPRYVVHTIPLADRDLNIPPHAANHTETITRPVPTDIHVLAYMAHMHVRGKSFAFELKTPDGKAESLLEIPHYDFNWQLRYDYREPRLIPKGSHITVTAVFDNSSDNPANPDPEKRVRWGQQTYEEMMIGYVETFSPVGTEPESGGGRLGEGLFTMLDQDQDRRLSLDELEKAAHLAPRLRENPELLPRLLRRMDTDGDGQLDAEEFQALRRQVAGQR